jgi:hypothetical protein
MAPILRTIRLLYFSILIFACAAWSAKIYVKADASGSNNGTSWTNAYITMQDALTTAVSGDSIFAAYATYKPHTADRTVSFKIKSGVKVFGGFIGNENPIDALTFNNRNFITHETMLSGDLAGNDNSGGNTSENSFHVVHFDSHSGNISTATVLDGFTITAGNADSIYQSINPFDRGGGIYNDGSVNGGTSNPLLRNLVIKGNKAKVGGGGMYNNAQNGLGEASPTLVNISFQNNTASAGNGGGLYNGASGKSSPILSNVAFISNSASGNGGGMYNYGYSGSLTHDTIHGLCCPIIRNALFYGNVAGSGGGIYNETGEVVGNIGGTCKPVILNATFYGNSGTAISSNETNMNSICEVTLKNSILWNRSETK